MHRSAALQARQGGEGTRSDDLSTLSLRAPQGDPVMDRRRVVQAGGAAVLLVGSPILARAQPGYSLRHIGFLSPGTPPTYAEIQEDWASLRELGWIEGKNLTIERRYTAGSVDLLRSFAQQLVDLKVEIVVTNGTAATLAAKNSTATIPIVMWSAGDPVRNGLVASLAQPGGNVTGYALLSPETAAKRLSLLRELLPRTDRVGELEVSTNPYFRAARRDLEHAYRSVAMQPIFVEVAQPNEFEEAVAEVARQRGQVLHVPNDDLFGNNAPAIMRAALKYALPTVVDRRELLEAGGLLHYSIDLSELRRRVAVFIDRILRGAKPRDLPVEQPTQFELWINMKTAKALNVTVPQSLRSRADRVIE
jgi:putative ABC transport system substrate-binding protein